MIAGSQRLLALDIATRTGFAVDNPEGDAPITGTIDIRHTGGDGLGPALASFRDWLSGTCAVHQPSIIIFEAPLNVHSGMPTTMRTVRMLLGLAAVTELVAEDRGCDTMEVKVEDWRMHFLGRARKTKGEPANILKTLCLDRCRELGWDVRGHDAADAAAIWHYSKTELNNRKGAT